MFHKFSSWDNLVHSLSLLKLAASRKTFHVDEISVKNLKAAEQLILKKVQEAYFRKEIKSLKSGKAVADDSSLSPLQPYLDEEEVLRIGERFKRANLSRNMRNPIIVPSGHILPFCLLDTITIASIIKGVTSQRERCVQRDFG